MEKEWVNPNPTSNPTPNPTPKPQEAHMEKSSMKIDEFCRRLAEGHEVDSHEPATGAPSGGLERRRVYLQTVLVEGVGKAMMEDFRKFGWEELLSLQQRLAMTYPTSAQRLCPPPSPLPSLPSTPLCPPLPSALPPPICPPLASTLTSWLVGDTAGWLGASSLQTSSSWARKAM